jgi:hypothetical protein
MEGLIQILVGHMFNHLAASEANLRRICEEIINML